MQGQIQNFKEEGAQGSHTPCKVAHVHFCCIPDTFLSYLRSVKFNNLTQWGDALTATQLILVLQKFAI